MLILSRLCLSVKKKKPQVYSLTELSSRVSNYYKKVFVRQKNKTKVHAGFKMKPIYLPQYRLKQY